MDSYSWKEDPVFTSMEPEKYRFLVQILEEAGKQDKKKMVPFFTAALSRANAAGITFTNEETAHILQAISPHMSAAERKRMQMIQTMMLNISKKKQQP